MYFGFQSNLCKLADDEKDSFVLAPMWYGTIVVVSHQNQKWHATKRSNSNFWGIQKEERATLFLVFVEPNTATFSDSRPCH